MKIYVEANIGAGKSTLLRLLGNRKLNNIRYIQEPVNEWLETKDSTGKNILEYFYENQNKWSFPFQMNSFISRTHSIAESKDDVIFAERSVYTDKYCFAQNCYESGKMTEMEWNIYNKWHSWLVDSFKLKPEAYIYLRTSPQTCINRIKERSRNEESTIPLDYLEKLHQKHEEWLLDKNSDIPVLTIDAEKNLFDENELNSVVDQIDSFLKTNFNYNLV